MAGHFQEFIAWITAHPYAALVLLFFTSLLDAVFLIGAFVPAAAVLFGLGALVALGSVDYWPAVLVASAGAVAGDFLSFYLGRRYGDQLFDWKLLRRYPEAIANGRRFFERHGGKGVMLARFLGPMRAITPAVAGAARMDLRLFLLADSAAAVPWAMLYITPGVVFGASLGLASEVAGRLALLLLILVAVLGLSLWLMQLILATVRRHAEDWIGALLDWSRRHRRLGKFGAALADSEQPETPVLALMALVLLIISAAVLNILGAPESPMQPLPWDAAVFIGLRELHTPWGLSLAQAVLQWGEWTVFAPVAAAGLLSLALRRSPRAAAHWLAALVFGGALSLGLYLIPTLPPPQTLLGGPDMGLSNPRELVLAVVIYSFVPVLLARQRPAPQAALLYGGAVSLLLLLSLAQLYAGTQWFSLVLFSLVVGVIWTALLGLGYRRHRPERIPGRGFLIPVLGTFLIASALQWRQLEPPQANPAEPGSAAVALSASAWWETGWESLPPRRVDVRGRDRQLLNVQWAGDLSDIDQLLQDRGWQRPQPLGAAGMLRWLSSATPISELPLLPRFHAGAHQVLSLRRGIDDSHQYLLRLWPSGQLLDDGRALWIGTLVVQEARPVARLLRYPINTDIYTQALDSLQLPLPGVEAKAARRAGASYTTLLLRPAPSG